MLVLAAAPPHYLFPTLKLKLSWSHGCEIAESSWLTDTSKTVAGADDASADDATELKWEFDEDLGRYFISFPVDQ